MHYVPIPFLGHNIGAYTYRPHHNLWVQNTSSMKPSTLEAKQGDLADMEAKSETNRKSIHNSDEIMPQILLPFQLVVKQSNNLAFD